MPSPGTIIVGLLLLAVAVLAARSLWRGRKSGGGCSCGGGGCSGDCSSCCGRGSKQFH